MKQEYIDGMRSELYREECEKYRFLHKYIISCFNH